MTEDLINNKDIYFPSYLGTNDKLINLLNKASQTLCDWFSKTDNQGRMDINDLRNSLDKCSIENKKIFAIVATLGTTVRLSLIHI